MKGVNPRLGKSPTPDEPRTITLPLRKQMRQAAIASMIAGLKENHPNPPPTLKSWSEHLDDLEIEDTEAMLSDLKEAIDMDLTDARLTRVDLVKALMYISHVIDIHLERTYLDEEEAL